nr:carbonic anhydrase 4-like [Halyomorpha halys]
MQSQNTITIESKYKMKMKRTTYITVREEEEVKSTQSNESVALKTMTQEECDDLEKEYLEEKEAERIKAQDLESEKKKALQTIKCIVQRRMRKGCRPSQTIEELLSSWIEQCDVMERPIIVELPRREARVFNRDVVPECGYYDLSQYVIQAVKWKTKKEKYRGQQRDSPIDIVTEEVKKCKYYRKLSITGLWNKDKSTTIYNAGDSVRGTISGEVFLSSGPLFGNYKFEHFSLKYGDKPNDGTEHSINGERFALEFQMNFSQLDCPGCPPKVLKTRSSKAVLVVLFEENKVQQQQYYELFSFIPHLDKVGKKITVTNNLLCDFKNILFSTEYYNYIGSSIEKPYRPNVEWIIFKKTEPIHKSQLELLWKLRMDGCLKPTFRPIKPIGERLIFEPSYKYHDKCRGKPICEC